MTYQTPGCSYCPAAIRACRQGEGEELLNRAGCELNAILGT